MSTPLFDLSDGTPQMSVTSSGGKNVAETKEAWALWEKLTKRPMIGSAPLREFSKRYHKLLNAGYPQKELIELVHAAARMDRAPGDTKDIKRLLNTLNVPMFEEQALALLRKDAPIILYKEYEAAGEDSCTIADLADAVGVSFTSWPQREYDFAGPILVMLTKEQVGPAAERVKALTGQAAIWPSEMLRHSKVWHDDNVKVARRADRDAYHGGASESEVLASVDLTLDTRARELLVNGCPPKHVLEFHSRMPDGYWDAVDEVLSRPEAKYWEPEEAYRALKSEYDTHPDDRTEPTW